MDTKEKSVQLFTYLKELSALRTKQVKNINNYEEVLWFSDIPKLAELLLCSMEFVGRNC